MLLIYRCLINIIFILSPFILIFRLLKKKEDLNRFKEKLCFFSKRRKDGKLIWFHGASVGELQSIMTIVQKIENDNQIKQILITSNTLSSSKIINKYKFKKIIHQFFPIDTNSLSNKFLDYWKPSAVFFIDSEIWPNMLYNIKKRRIPIGLINGRISKQTFQNWKKIPKFSKEIFEKFDLCLTSNKETKNYLKKLGNKNVNFLGNLKFSQMEKEENLIDKNTKDFFLKKTLWCASSTHKKEEILCAQIHKELKIKFKNLLTIIIPRHVNRIDSIKEELDQLNLKIHMHEPKKKIKKNTDIYLVNSYGKNKSFYSLCKNVFLGGSMINHGGQNPLEAARYGCNILNGPYVYNFTDVYKFLEKIKISKKISNFMQMKNQLEINLHKNQTNRKNKKNLKNIGNKILSVTYKKINSLIYNEI